MLKLIIAVVCAGSIAGYAAVNVVNTGSVPPGTRYNFASPSPANRMDGDTYSNAACSDGVDYLALNDTDNPGFPGATSSVSISRFTQWSTAPVNLASINLMTSFGSINQVGGPDNRAWKQFGLTCLPAQAGGDVLLMSVARQNNNASGFQHLYGGLIKSYDHGATWTNFTHPSSAGVSNGDAPSPTTSNMFGSSNTDGTFSTLNFVQYSTGGLTAPAVDNQNLYVYLLASGITTGACAANGCSQFSNGNLMYLMRVARAVVENLNPADYEVYTGGDGMVDANWSLIFSNAVSIYSTSAQTSSTNINCAISGISGCVMIQWFYPNQADATNASWVWLWGPHPWGPFQIVRTDSLTGTGNFNPQILHASITTPSSIRIISPGNYNTYSGSNCGTNPACLYSLYYFDVSVSLSPIIGRGRGSTLSGMSTQ